MSKKIKLRIGYSTVNHLKIKHDPSINSTNMQYFILLKVIIKLVNPKKIIIFLKETGLYNLLEIKKTA